MRVLPRCILPRARLPVLLFVPSLADRYRYQMMLSQPDLVQCTLVPPLAGLELQSLARPAHAGVKLGRSHALHEALRDILAMRQPVRPTCKSTIRNRGGVCTLTLRHSLPSTNATEPFGRTNLVGGGDDLRRISTAVPVSGSPVCDLIQVSDRSAAEGGAAHATRVRWRSRALWDGERAVRLVKPCQWSLRREWRCS